MNHGFVTQSAKVESSTCRHGRPAVTCRLLYKAVLLLVFWTHSLEMDEWSGFSWLKAWQVLEN